jgi:hypothetical protein
MTHSKTNSMESDINPIDSFTQSELRSWVRERLQGQAIETISDARQNNFPHYVVASIYPNLDRDSRQFMRQIILEFLWEMAREEGTEWQEESAHSLLMLAQKLGEHDFIEPIREMALEQTFFQTERIDSVEDIHRRLLQSLVVLKWVGDCAFWHAQFELAPEHYAGVVFAGLVQIALEHAIHLLPEISWESEEVQSQMEIALRGLLPRYPHDHIGKALAKILPNLSEQAELLISEYLPEIKSFMRVKPVWGTIKEMLEVLKEQPDLKPQDFQPRSLIFAETDTKEFDGIYVN